MNKGYVNIKIPSELAQVISKVVEDNSLGFRSKSEFVVFCVRRTLLELGKGNLENNITHVSQSKEETKQKVSPREVENPSVQKQSFVSSKVQNEGLPSYFIGNPWLGILQSRR
jgi:hypothetical protein